MAERWTLERASRLFETRGCKLLETEYVSNKYKMRYVAKCGHEHTISLDNFMKGKGDYCRACRYKAIGDKQKLGTDHIIAYFEQEGCKVMDPGDETNSHRVKYIALCGHENEITYGHFTMGGGRVCSKCSRSIQYGYDYVKECFENEDCELLETEYINCKTPMRYIAKCGHESTITFDMFLNSSSATKRCPKCHKIIHHEITEDRNKSAYKKWRYAVFDRDGRRCAVCRKDNCKLNAHHLAAYNSDPDKRFELSNGITLCVACHTAFHKAYGWQNNTPEQFQEWLKGIPR